MRAAAKPARLNLTPHGTLISSSGCRAIELALPSALSSVFCCAAGVGFGRRPTQLRNELTLPALNILGGHSEGIVMIKIPANIHLRTRLPLTAWVLLVLVTLFSMVSSLVHYVTPSLEQAASVAGQATKAHRADMSW